MIACDSLIIKSGYFGYLISCKTGNLCNGFIFKNSSSMCSNLDIRIGTDSHLPILADSASRRERQARHG